VLIQMVPRVEGETRAVLMAALSSEYLHPKIAVTVDEDVDPYDPRELLWSLSTKVNPADDVFIINGTPGHSLDASLPRITPYEVNPVIRVGSRMGIDACKPPLSQGQHRVELARLWPKGYGQVRLEDFLAG
jgi:2,5-furandicarboxylate decarboxylase 1